jgi:dihydrofolate reductase
MRSLVADLFVSLDGFAGGEGTGAFFGYPGPGLERWIAEQLDQPQVIAMGRVTYQALAGMGRLDDRMATLPKLVFSNTLSGPLAWPSTRVVRGDAADAMHDLKQEEGDQLRTIGSITLVRALIESGLVDRLRLMVFPLLLGSAGREPVFAGYSPRRFELADKQVLDSRLVLLEYSPLGS